MATTTYTPDTSNTFESTVSGYTVRGKAHSLSAWFVLSLRLMMGYAFAYSGFDKLTAAEPFGAGRILGLDAIIESYDLDGQPLVERYPGLDYIPG